MSSQQDAAVTKSPRRSGISNYLVSRTSRPPDRKSMQVCYHYIHGVCRFGERCQNLHEWPSSKSLPDSRRKHQESPQSARPNADYQPHGHIERHSTELEFSSSPAAAPSFGCEWSSGEEDDLNLHDHLKPDLKFVDEHIDDSSDAEFDSEGCVVDESRKGILRFRMSNKRMCGLDESTGWDSGEEDIASKKQMTLDCSMSKLQPSPRKAKLHTDRSDVPEVVQEAHQENIEIVQSQQCLVGASLAKHPHEWRSDDEQEALAGGVLAFNHVHNITLGEFMGGDIAIESASPATASELPAIHSAGPVRDRVFVDDLPSGAQEHSNISPDEALAPVADGVIVEEYPTITSDEVVGPDADEVVANELISHPEEYPAIQLDQVMAPVVVDELPIQHKEFSAVQSDEMLAPVFDGSITHQNEGHSAISTDEDEADRSIPAIRGSATNEPPDHSSLAPIAQDTAMDYIRSNVRLLNAQASAVDGETVVHLSTREDENVVTRLPVDLECLNEVAPEGNPALRGSADDPSETQAHLKPFNAVDVPPPHDIIRNTINTETAWDIIEPNSDGSAAAFLKSLKHQRLRSTQTRREAARFKSCNESRSQNVHKAMAEDTIKEEALKNTRRGRKTKLRDNPVNVRPAFVPVVHRSAGETPGRLFDKANLRRPPLRRMKNETNQWKTQSTYYHDCDDELDDDEDDEDDYEEDYEEEEGMEDDLWPISFLSTAAAICVGIGVAGVLALYRLQRRRHCHRR